jgi:hypothetical protein
LPDWKYQLLRYNIDVMHTEKNVVDNILGTLLDMSGKTKDKHEARQDLRKMKLRTELHPFIAENGKGSISSALTPKEQEMAAEMERLKTLYEAQQEELAAIKRMVALNMTEKQSSMGNNEEGDVLVYT